MTEVRCEMCDHIMSTDESSCTLDYVKIKEKYYKRNTRHHDNNEICHDCGILNGGVHHFGCDMEECPVCKGQMFCCDCDVTAFSTPKFKSEAARISWEKKQSNLWFER